MKFIFYQFLQYRILQTMEHVKRICKSKGIQIIGDIPIYVAYDSADVWSTPRVVQLDESGQSTAVAGCPPDGFFCYRTALGKSFISVGLSQRNRISWWVNRIRGCFRLYDIMRIDHFRGFDEYYSIPYGDPTAENGHWEKGPGMDLFHKIKQELGDLPIIAEDLGFLTDSVKQLLKDSGYPGMKVLQFAFDSRKTVIIFRTIIIKLCCIHRYP